MPLHSPEIAAQWRDAQLATSKTHRNGELPGKFKKQKGRRALVPAAFLCPDEKTWVRQDFAFGLRAPA
jgi:hypothetical protein